MAKEKPESELMRLVKEQAKALEHEVFGGLSPEEREERDRRQKRINVLSIELAASRTAKKKSRSAKAE